MEPGRELDAVVAEKIMNWDNVHCLSGGNVPFGRPDDDYRRAFPSAMYSEPVPSYSTDIAAAFIIDKPGWLWEFQESVGVLTVTLYTSPEMWRQAIKDYPIFPKGAVLVRRAWLDDKAKTYAWVRCLAALEAVGVEVRDDHSQVS